MFDWNFCFFVEEIENTHQNPETEIENGYEKEEITTSESSPRAVLEIPISEGSSVSGSPTSSCSSASMEKLCSPTKSGGTAPFNPLYYGYQLKGFIDTMKKKSGVGKFSTNTINLLSNYDLSAKSLRKKLARIRSAEDSCLLSQTKHSWRNFKYSELSAATDHFSPGKEFRPPLFLSFSPSLLVFFWLDWVGWFKSARLIFNNLTT